MHGFLLLWHKVSLEKSLAAVSTDYFFAPKKRGRVGGEKRKEEGLQRGDARKKGGQRERKAQKRN